jgi:hypothetical protein
MGLLRQFLEGIMYPLYLTDYPMLNNLSKESNNILCLVNIRPFFKYTELCVIWLTRYFGIV